MDNLLKKAMELNPPNSGRLPTRAEIAAQGVETEGQCFVNAAKIQQENLPEWTLCHGLVMQPNLRFYHCHAWLEIGNFCLDVAKAPAKCIPKDIYYEAGEIDPAKVKRYTRMQAAKMMCDHATFGPWEVEDGIS